MQGSLRRAAENSALKAIEQYSNQQWSHDIRQQVTVEQANGEQATGEQANGEEATGEQATGATGNLVNRQPVKTGNW